MKRLAILLNLVLILIVSNSYAGDGDAGHIVFGPYFNASGTLYPSIKVHHYSIDTTTNKDCWSDAAKTTPVVDPFVGDTKGVAQMYCDGIYDIVIKDASSNILYTWNDVQITADTATEWEFNRGTALPTCQAQSATGTNHGQAFTTIDNSYNLTSYDICSDGSWANIIEKTTTGEFVFDSLYTKEPTINVKHPDYGALGDNINDDVEEIQAAIDDAESLGSATQHPRILLPCGTYKVSTALNIYNANADHYTFEGETYGCVTIEGTGVTGNVINVTGREVHLKNLIIDASAPRTAGSGYGIYADNSGAAQSRLILKNVRVLDQPTDGIRIVDPELHYFENVDITTSGVYGLHILADGAYPLSNTFVNLRIWSNTGIGLYMTGTPTSNTFINLQAYMNAGTAQAHVTGRSNIFINPDIEDQNNNGLVGMHIEGTNHKIVGGLFSSLTTGIELASASDVIIEHPFCIDADNDNAGITCVTIDAHSHHNILYFEEEEEILTADVRYVTALYTEADTSVGTTIIMGGKYKQSMENLIRKFFTFADPVVTDATSKSYMEVGPLTADTTISAPITTNDSCTASTAPYACCTGLDTGTCDDAQDGQYLVYQFLQDGTGGWDITWDSVFQTDYSNSGNIANAEMSIGFRYNSRTNNWYQETKSPWHDGAGEDATIREQIVALTPTNVNDLETTAITLVAAQGADTIVEFISATLVADMSTAWTCTNADNKLRARYTDGSGTIVSEAIDMNTFLEGTIDEIRFMDKQVTSDTDVLINVNKALVLDNEGTGDCITGTASELRVHTLYKVHKLKLD